VKPSVCRKKIKQKMSDARDHTRIDVFLDEDPSPVASFRPPEAFELDTTKLSDGPHKLTIRAIDNKGSVSVREIRFEVHNGPGIDVVGLRPGDLVEGKIPVLVNAYAGTSEENWEPRRAETPAPVPTWAWVLFLAVTAWAMFYWAEDLRPGPEFANTPTYASAARIAKAAEVQASVSANPAPVRPAEGTTSSSSSPPSDNASQPAAVSWHPPELSSISPGPQGDSIRLGRNIIAETTKYAAHYVGNGMKCGDCHLNAGTFAGASPLAGVTTLFPAYSQRAKRVITIEDRIEECFVRSENGKPLPYGGPEMAAVVAYMTWLSQGVPVGSTVQGRGFPKVNQPSHVDPQHGAKVYADKCSACHGSDGRGVTGAFPPLWGPRSFNDGAGMSHVEKMAAFVKANMPPTSPGSLSAQDAFDVAAFVEGKPRPKFNPQYSRY
jgi:thiosulfate dehydrogenase